LADKKELLSLLFLVLTDAIVGFFCLFLTYLGLSYFSTFLNLLVIAGAAIIALAQVAPPRFKTAQWKIGVFGTAFGCYVSYLLGTLQSTDPWVILPSYLGGNLSIFSFLVFYSYFVSKEIREERTRAGEFPRIDASLWQEIDLPNGPQRAFLPHVGTLFINHGESLLKLKVVATVFLGNEQIDSVTGDVHGYYSGRTPIEMLPKWKFWGNFGIQDRCVTSSEVLRVQLNIEAVDELAKKYRQLYFCYTFDRDKNEWFLEPIRCKDLIKKEVGPPPFERSPEFRRLRHYMSLLQGAKAKETRAEILAQLRDFLPILPYENWSKEVKSAIDELLEVIVHELQDEHARLKCLDILDVITSKSDELTKSKIKDMFYKKLEEFYESGDKAEKKYSLAIMQELQGYNLTFMSGLLDQAVNLDNDQEFQEVFDKIRLYRMSSADKEELQRNLFAKRDELELSGETRSKLRTRLDTVLDTLRQIV